MFLIINTFKAWCLRFLMSADDHLAWTWFFANYILGKDYMLTLSKNKTCIILSLWLVEHSSCTTFFNWRISPWWESMVIIPSPNNTWFASTACSWPSWPQKQGPFCWNKVCSIRHDFQLHAFDWLNCIFKVCLLPQYEIWSSRTWH